eukprot:scaffold16610_cov135-Isochrysis_galbana.AAC.3
MPPVGPWRCVCVSACDIPGALRSRRLVRVVSVSGSVMTSLTSGLYEPPHDNPSSLMEEGFNSSSRKRARQPRMFRQVPGLAVPGAEV